MADLPDRLKDQPIQLRPDEPIEVVPPMSLHRKLAQVLYEAERIPKNGTAPKEMGGYKFVQVGDAADYIRKALAEKVLTMMPTAVHVVGQQDRPTSRGGNMTTVDLVVEWTISDGESGESIVIQSFGAGADGGDKYSGKAMTSAMKYALLSGFLLSTGDDTEASKLPDQLPPPSEPDVRQEITTDGGLIGTAEKGTARTSDYLLRQTSEGWFLGFRLKGGGRKAGFLVEAHDAMAQALVLLEGDVIGQRCQVWGHWVERKLTKGSYQAFYLERITTPTFTLPAPDGGGHTVAPETPSELSGDHDDVLPTDAAGASSKEAAVIAPASSFDPGENEPLGRFHAGESSVAAPSAESDAEKEAAVQAARPRSASGQRVEAGATGAAPALCLAKGPDSIPGGAVCNQEPHPVGTKHRELATDGRVLASW